MIKLFLSHASEDKDSFVRPLAEALRKEFEVWYDEYELLLGDSLLKKITEGLKNCDYGVVVLSPHFFSKKWTGDELDGLFSLETTERKVILPIWKDVTVDDVKKFSPMLAGRLGVTVESGIEKVIHEIKRAVGLVERDRGLQKRSSWKDKFASIADDLDYRRKITALAHSTQGITKVSESAARILSAAESNAFELIRSHPEFNIRVNATSGPNFLLVRGLGVLALRFQYWEVYGNSIDGATLEIALFNDHGSFLGNEQNQIDGITLHPDFDRELNVIWKGDTHSPPDEEAVLGLAFDMFAKAIERFIKRNHA